MLSNLTGLLKLISTKLHLVGLAFVEVIWQASQKAANILFLFMQVMNCFHLIKGSAEIVEANSGFDWTQRCWEYMSEVLA